MKLYVIIQIFIHENLILKFSIDCFSCYIFLWSTRFYFSSPNVGSKLWLIARTTECSNLVTFCIIQVRFYRWTLKQCEQYSDLCFGFFNSELISFAPAEHAWEKSVGRACRDTQTHVSTFVFIFSYKICKILNCHS